MTVPETTINVNDGPVARKYKIGFAREIFDVQAVAETSRMQALSYQELRFGIFTPDS